MNNLSQNLTENSANCRAGSILDDYPFVRNGLIACYATEFVICFSGNLLLLFVVARIKSMQTTPNFFLGNLAIADLLVAIFCMVQNCCQILIFRQGDWPLGPVLCHFYVFALHFVPCISAGILVLVSIERYIVVLYPLVARSILTKQLLATLTVVVWVFGFISNVPYLLTSKHYEWRNRTSGEVLMASCSRDFNSAINMRTLFTTSFILWYCIPLLLLAYLYTRISMVLWRSAAGPLKLPTHKRLSGAYYHSTMATAAVPLQQIREDAEAGEITDETTRELNAIDSLPAKRPSCRRLRWSKQSCSEESAILSSSHPITSPGRKISTSVEGRRKIIHLLLVIVCSFSVLTLPNHIRLLWTVWRTNIRMCNQSFLMLSQPLCYLALFLQNGLNPVLYAFLSDKFRNALAAALQCRGVGGLASYRADTGGDMTMGRRFTKKETTARRAMTVTYRDSTRLTHRLQNSVARSKRAASVC